MLRRMKHYLYAMSGSSPSITGRGTVKDWFEYYKLNNGPDVFVPFTKESLLEEPQPGDIVWFITDFVLTGFATITSFRADGVAAEVFYDSDKVTMILVETPVPVSTPLLEDLYKQYTEG